VGRGNIVAGRGMFGGWLGTALQSNDEICGHMGDKFSRLMTGLICEYSKDGRD
jgi:hypothetical protein